MKPTKYIIMMLSAMLMASCIDTVILPENKTVDEDYWKTKSDVQQIVNNAYRGMVSENVITRLIVWGDLRSDEIMPNTSTTVATADREALTQINTVNIKVTNKFATWADLYSVINYCNIVLSKCGDVVSIDPDYTKGDCQSDSAQMLALRALCHYYLVRTFRDIPYATEAYMNSSMDLHLPQLAPATVIDNIIGDLETAEQIAVPANAYNDWRQKGQINIEAIRAMLADVYLWRASINHSAADYQKCADYCELIINAKEQRHIVPTGKIDERTYKSLSEGTEMFANVFVTKNAEESIFELQCDGDNNSNAGVCKSYYKYKDGTAVVPMMFASKVMGISSTSTSNNAFATEKDYRFWNFCYSCNDDTKETFEIRKMVSESKGSARTSAEKVDASRSFKGYAQNYVVYRLSDVMLMEAEALVQLAAADAATATDANLTKAFDLVKAVYDRSFYDVATNSLKVATYNTKDKMEKLVMDERLRELCFEGKRWYDLLRYNYRHTDGVDYTTTLADQAERGVSFATNYDDMLKLVIRKYGAEGSAVQTKMKTEPYLYLPIPNSDIEIDPLYLRQNPVYGENDKFKKNV